MTTERIRETIKRSGWHISLIAGGPVPVYAHTIGMNEHRDFELLWAGFTAFARDQIAEIVNTAGTLILENGVFTFRGDTFRLVPVDPSWSRLLARQAYEFDDAAELDFLQIVPTTRMTFDVPDLSRPYDEATAGVWRWLTAKWPYDLPRGAMVSTDLHVLQGEPITAIERWDATLFSAHSEKEWEDSELRQVPLGSIIGHDASCEAAVRLNDGERITRAGADDAWCEPFDLLDKPL